MTEAEWLTCADPQRMLAFQRGRLTERTLRLFACACVCRAWGLLGKGGRKAVRAAEAWADGCLDPGSLDRAMAAAQREAAAAEQGASRKWGTAATASRVLARRAVPAVAIADPEAPGGRDIAAALALRALRPTDPCLYYSGIAAEGVMLRHYPKARGGPDKLLEREAVRRATAAVQDAWWSERQTQAGLLRCLVGWGQPVACGLRWRTPEVLGLTQAIHEEGEFDLLPILADALVDAGCANEEILYHLRGPAPHVRGCWALACLLARE